MPCFNIVKEWENPHSFRAESIIGSFTLTDVKLRKVFTGAIPIENENWQIGVIVGRSGTGKTSIAKKLFPEEYINGFQYTHSSILDDFPEDLSVDEITRALSNVGFASPPDWLKSYDQLSQGEKMRVDIARALTLNSNLIVFDEFTSVVDREIAQIASFAVQKAIRKTDKKFIAVTCHYDVLDWLEPDWIFYTDTMSFDKKKEAAQKLNSRSSIAAFISGTTLKTITI